MKKAIILSIAFALIATTAWAAVIRKGVLRNAVLRAEVAEIPSAASHDYRD